MAINDPGTGGGPAGAATSATYALDKPFDLEWPITPDQIQRLNEMLSTLFRNQTRAASDIASAGGVSGPTSSTSGNMAVFGNALGTLIADAGSKPLKFIEIPLTNTQLTSLSSTPQNLLAAQGSGVIIQPAWVAIEVVQTVAFGAAQNWQLQYAGLAGINLVTATTNDFNNNRNKYFWFPGISVSAVGANSVVTNKAVQISLSADPAGGTASAVVTMAYYLRTSSSL